jgi:RNA polymerase sigma-70 factor (ECF subfamily)
VLNTETDTPVERQLLVRTKSGDRRAFEGLILANTARAYRTAYRLLGNMEDAFDLCQEAFLRAYQNIHRFDENRAFYPWLYSILKNLCLNFLKRKRKQPSAIGDPQLWERTFATSLPGPAEQILQSEDVKRLWQAIDGLSESHRRVLIMKHFDNLSYAEMAEILSIPIGTVMSRLYHARKRLGEIYDNL